MLQKFIHGPWPARAAVGGVFAINITCALAFIFQPEQYCAGFEIGGTPGLIVVQGFGILFLMWNVTYPPVILNPQANKNLFTLILIQQAIGLIGETWLALRLSPGHTALWATGLRFILFDGAGLALMGTAYSLLKT